MARSDLIKSYIESLPFGAISVVASAGGGCRVAVGGELLPGEAAIATYWVRPLHLELVLGAAGLGDGPLDQSPVAIASLIRGAAKGVGAPMQTEKQLRAAAEIEVDKILERVRASNQAGGMKLINKQFKRYRLAQLEKAEPAVGYQKFIEPFVMTMLRQVAMTGRMI
jgi:hypothetical protein